MISIFSHSQKSFVEALSQISGKGAWHATKLYSDWFRLGSCTAEAPWIEPQAKQLVEKMLAQIDFSLPELVAEKHEGESVKFILKYSDGVESESVIIPMKAGATLCISSQIGCKMGCAFCETGRMGLIRHLSAKEIVAQVFYARLKLNADIRNIVFMGMGEPLDNYEEVMQAVKVLTDPYGLNFGPSRITISTSGKVDMIYKLIDDADPALNLAVSVNASNDETRRRLMPVNKSWDMTALKGAMQAYCAHPRREILVEYVLLKGINDSLSCADELADYLRGLKVKVNLIPYNSQSRDRFAPPEQADREAFLKRMREHGYQTLLRGTKGSKIMAACGQLGNIKLRVQLKQREQEKEKLTGLTGYEG